MKKALILGLIFISSVSIGAASVYAAASPLFSSAPSVESSVQIASSTSSVYVVHDAPQQNTCYVVLSGSSQSSISCVADHVSADFPASGLPANFRG